MGHAARATVGRARRRAAAALVRERPLPPHAGARALHPRRRRRGRRSCSAARCSPWRWPSSANPTSSELWRIGVAARRGHRCRHGARADRGAHARRPACPPPTSGARRRGDRARARGRRAWRWRSTQVEDSARVRRRRGAPVGRAALRAGVGGVGRPRAGGDGRLGGGAPRRSVRRSRRTRDAVILLQAYAAITLFGDARASRSRSQERDTAEDARATAAERFRRTFHDSPVAMAVTTLDGRIVETNRALCQLLATPDHALVGTELARHCAPTTAVSTSCPRGHG